MPNTPASELTFCHENVSTYTLVPHFQGDGETGLVLIPPKYFSKYKKIFKMLSKPLDPSVCLDTYLLKLRVLDTE